MKIPAYCGFDCTGCPVYQATVAGDTVLQQRLADKYATPDCALEPGDMVCPGCLSPEVDGSKMCGACPMRSCARPRGLATCADCTDYPCAIIEQCLPPGQNGRTRLDALKQDNL